VFRDFSDFSRALVFFLLTSSLLTLSLLCLFPPLHAASSVHIVGGLASKHPSASKPSMSIGRRLLHASTSQQALVALQWLSRICSPSLAEALQGRSAEKMAAFRISKP